ncbi:MAG: NAD-dependent epimerase/dehydratase family protein [Candidatus Methanoculleus thermohydrogenotrophicum]|nr:NAD-dependent epimerase/dehydratase family protein [Candidatus Methanoculleus thermohydrogenotrophicum]
MIPHCRRVAEYEVVIIDNLDDYYSPDLKRRNLKLLLANPNVRFIEGDITDSDLLRRVIDSDVEFVFHEAAQAGVRISVEDPFKPNDVNVLGTLNVLKASLDAGVKRMINASSSSVYGRCSTCRSTKPTPPCRSPPTGSRNLPPSTTVGSFTRSTASRQSPLRLLHGLRPPDAPGSCDIDLCRKDACKQADHGLWRWQPDP